MTLVVDDYEEAITFYTQRLNFELIEGTCIERQDKRRVLIKTPDERKLCVLLVKGSGVGQAKCIGNQTGARLFTANFWRDYNEMDEKGIHFVCPPLNPARVWL